MNVSDASKSASGCVDSDSKYFDYIETPLNACSLESFCHHHALPKRTYSKGLNSNNDDDDDDIHNESESSLIPLCLGCYQLNESTGYREGRLDLYAVPIVHRSSNNNIPDSIEAFGAPPLNIFGANGEKEPTPGVLDGKWSNHTRWLSSPSSGTFGGFQNYYATAHANGEIWVHEIRSTTQNYNDGNTGGTASNINHSFESKLAGKSESPSSSEGLCLALAWENPLYGENHDDDDETDDTNACALLDTRIISSYSDGSTAIHRVRGRRRPSLQNDDDTNAGDERTTKQLESELELTLEHHWDSHKIFTCPAEVWCANFIDSNTVVTGGDEGSWKIWDLRQPLVTNRPVHHGKDDFGAGVTVLAPHPKRKGILAIGSYDETIALMDLRKVVSGNRRPETLYRSESLGGGIWRCKWHPSDENKLLVAAMHGGCVVGTFDGLSAHWGTPGGEPPPSEAVRFQVVKEFKLHKSMAYGIDWLVGSNKPGVSGVEAAASCSFYDKAMYLWNTRST